MLLKYVDGLVSSTIGPLLALGRKRREKIRFIDSHFGYLFLTYDSQRTDNFKPGCGFSKSLIKAYASSYFEYVERLAVTSLTNNTSETYASACSVFPSVSIERAKNELIERDAVVNAWAARAVRGSIDCSVPVLLKKQGFKVLAFHLHSHKPHVALVTLIKPLSDQDSIVYFGSGYGESTLKAAEKALFEAIMQLEIDVHHGRINVLRNSDFDWVYNPRFISSTKTPADHQYFETRKHICRLRGLTVAVVSCKALSGLAPRRTIHFSYASYSKLHLHEPTFNGIVPVLGANNIVEIP